MSEEADDKAAEDTMDRKLGFGRLELVRTCDAHPEQYDLLIDGQQAGYFRLRHGHFRVDYPNCEGEMVYEALPSGDGYFESDERAKYLTAGIAACIDRHQSGRMPTSKTDYLFALLREIERIHPPRQRGAHHGILWEPGDEGDILILLISMGDAYWKCRTSPADLSDDPVQTAARLAAQIKNKVKAGEDNDPADYL